MLHRILPPSSLRCRALATLALVSLTAPASSALGQSDDSPGVVRHPDFAELSARWASALTGMSVPGMAVVIVEGDRILHLETFGVRDVERDAPVTPETLFYIASATKPFVALACRQLVDEGRLDLDDPVVRYLPRLEFADPDVASTITVRDLLCHRPGISSFPVVFLDAYTGQITEDRYYHFLAESSPSGVVTYSNVHLTLAGRVLEAIEGVSWKDVLARRVFEPANMTRTTGYADAMYADADVAFPTQWRNGGFEYASVRKTDSTMHAAGGLGTTALDLANWLRLHLNRGKVGGTRVLSAEGMGEMLTRQSSMAARRNDGVDGFALGWMMGSSYGMTKFQHGGGYVGSAAMISFIPEIGVGVGVLSNAGGGGSALVDLVTSDVYRFLTAEIGDDPLPSMIRRAQQRGATASDSAPPEGNPALVDGALSLPASAYCGDYGNEFWGTVRVSLVDDHLVAAIGNVGWALHTQGVDGFHAYNADSFSGDGTFFVTERGVSAFEVEIADNRVRFEAASASESRAR